MSTASGCGLWAVGGCWLKPTHFFLEFQRDRGMIRAQPARLVRQRSFVIRQLSVIGTVGGGRGTVCGRAGQVRGSARPARDRPRPL